MRLPRRFPSGLPSWWDVVLTAVVGGGVVANGALALSTPRPTALIIWCGLVAAAALLFRRRLPLSTLVVITLLSALPTAVAGSFPDFYASFIPELAAVFAVAVHSSPARAVLVPIAIGAVLLVCALRAPAFLVPAQLVTSAVGFPVAYGAGRTVALLRQRADAEQMRAEVLLREQEIQAREAVVAERERIARELHDAVAHDVAVMVVHAGAATTALPEASGQVAVNLAQIQSSGRKAIDELHLLLGMLHGDRDPLAVQPGLADLGGLVDELRAAGLPVSLTVAGEVRQLGEAMEVSAYRVIQEALTNVLKHAPGSRTEVHVNYGASQLTLHVSDQGTGDSARSPGLPSGGHGLPGMHERVRLFGGALTAGSRAGGGWDVVAVLPLRGDCR